MKKHDKTMLPPSGLAGVKGGTCLPRKPTGPAAGLESLGSILGWMQGDKTPAEFLAAVVASVEKEKRR